MAKVSILARRSIKRAYGSDPGSEGTTVYRKKKKGKAVNIKQEAIDRTKRQEVFQEAQEKQRKTMQERIQDYSRKRAQQLAQQLLSRTRQYSYEDIPSTTLSSEDRSAIQMFKGKTTPTSEKSRTYSYRDVPTVEFTPEDRLAIDRFEGKSPKRGKTNYRTVPLTKQELITSEANRIKQLPKAMRNPAKTGLMKFFDNYILALNPSLIYQGAKMKELSRNEKTALAMIGLNLGAIATGIGSGHWGLSIAGATDLTRRLRGDTPTDIKMWSEPFRTRKGTEGGLKGFGYGALETSTDILGEMYSHPYLTYGALKAMPYAGKIAGKLVGAGMTRLSPALGSITGQMTRKGTELAISGYFLNMGKVVYKDAIAKGQPIETAVGMAFPFVFPIVFQYLANKYYSRKQFNKLVPKDKMNLASSVKKVKPSEFEINKVKAFTKNKKAGDITIEFLKKNKASELLVLEDTKLVVGGSSAQRTQSMLNRLSGDIDAYSGLPRVRAEQLANLLKKNGVNAVATGNKPGTIMETGQVWIDGIHAVSFHTKSWMKAFPYATTKETTPEGVKVISLKEQAFRKLEGYYKVGRRADMPDFYQIIKSQKGMKSLPEKPFVKTIGKGRGLSLSPENIPKLIEKVYTSPKLYSKPMTYGQYPTSQKYGTYPSYNMYPSYPSPGYNNYQTPKTYKPYPQYQPYTPYTPYTPYLSYPKGGAYGGYSSDYYGKYPPVTKTQHPVLTKRRGKARPLGMYIPRQIVPKVAYKPVLLNSKDNNIRGEDKTVFSSVGEATAEGMHKTDNTPFDGFYIKKILNPKLSNLRNARDRPPANKFNMNRKGVYSEKKRFRQDRPLERTHSGFNWLEHIKRK